MENKCGDTYNQVDSDPRPGWEYYPPGWQERIEEKTKEPIGYIPHVLLRPEPVNMKEHLLKLREIIDQALKEYD